MRYHKAVKSRAIPQNRNLYNLNIRFCEIFMVYGIASSSDASKPEYLRNIRHVKHRMPLSPHSSRIKVLDSKRRLKPNYNKGVNRHDIGARSFGLAHSKNWHFLQERNHLPPVLTVLLMRKIGTPQHCRKCVSAH